MEKKRSKGVSIFAILYPFFALFLVPEIINSVVWLLDFIATTSGLRRSIDNIPVGIGLIFTLVAFIIIGISIFLLSSLVIVLTIIQLKGLLRLLEKARRRTLILNAVYIAFIVFAICFFNAKRYCMVGPPGHQYKVAMPYEETKIRLLARYTDGIILVYLISALYFFTRPKVKEQFSNL